MKYFLLGHVDHLFCNPLGEQKVDELIGLLTGAERGRVLDIACGRGEVLRRVCRRWHCEGTGVDIEPTWLEEARALLSSGDQINLVCTDGAHFAASPASFDVTMCLGASWIWGGQAGTLTALARLTVAGGLVVVGEPFYRAPPDPRYLARTGLGANDFLSHAGNVQAGRDVGLTFLHAIVSSQDDWDRYEGYQWRAIETWASECPDDPDRDEVLQRMHAEQAAFLDWGRDGLGWAVYVFRTATPGEINGP